MVAVLKGEEIGKKMKVMKFWLDYSTKHVIYIMRTPAFKVWLRSFQNWASTTQSVELTASVLVIIWLNMTQIIIRLHSGRHTLPHTINMRTRTWAWPFYRGNFFPHTKFKYFPQNNEYSSLKCCTARCALEYTYRTNLSITMRNV